MSRITLVCLVKSTLPSNDLGDDHEAWNPAELAAFCGSGTITKIACPMANGPDAFTRGRRITCTIKSGFPWFASDQWRHIYCDDYEVTVTTKVTSFLAHLSRMLIGELIV